MTTALAIAIEIIVLLLISFSYFYLAYRALQDENRKYKKQVDELSNRRADRV